MNRKLGFTLVELLVVMAIIAILAAIAIPNVQRYIAKGKATRAIAEIDSIELAITKMLSDAGRSGLAEFYNKEAIEADYGAFTDWSADDFDEITEIYTNATIALLRKGREARSTADNYVSSGNIGAAGVELMREDAVRNLGTSYLADLSFDPWGNLYRIYPGTWPARYGLIVFRTYLPPSADTPRLPGDTAEDTADQLTLRTDGTLNLIDPDTGEPMDAIGVPANRRKEVYIWSFGANLESGQARYTAPDPSDLTAIPYADNDVTNYDNSNQEPELLGGGDDINNWDRSQTFMRFYN